MKSKVWTPEFDEGRHHRAQLGFILMSTDLACEQDLFDMAPEGVGVHITRLLTDDYTTNETLARHIITMEDAAARLQPDMRPTVVSYCCTSGSIVNGEAAVFDAIRRGAPWARPNCVATGVVDALRALNVKKLVVGTPYLDEINAVEATFLREKGFDVLDMQGLNLTTGLEFGRITPAYLVSFARAIDRPEADAVFLSCTGIRAVEVAQEIEDLIGKPVITSNQAHFWSCLRRACIEDEIVGYGQIFRHNGKGIIG